MRPRRPSFAFHPNLDTLPTRIAPVDMHPLVFSTGGMMPTMSRPAETTTATTLDSAAAADTTVMVEPTITPTC